MIREYEQESEGANIGKQGSKKKENGDLGKIFDAERHSCRKTWHNHALRKT
jgi:hypothetical protein